MKSGLRSSIVIVAAVFLSASLLGCRVKNVEMSAPATLVSISIRPSTPSMAPGTTMQLKAFGTYSNNAELNLTNHVIWQTSNPDVATVDSAGLATSIGSGSTTITAIFGSISGSTVLTSSPLVSIAITPADQTIASGTALQLSAVGTLLNTATQDITAFATWNSSDTSVAAITNTGLASASPSATGLTTITATFGTVSGSTTLTAAAVTSIAVTPSSATIVLGTTQQFTATGFLSGGAVQDLTVWATWNSSNTAIATISTTSAPKGLATSVSPGSTFITASFSGVTSNAATLTVNPAVLVSISITPTNPSIALGITQQFTATGVYSDGTTQNLTAAATWMSSNIQIATVSNASGTKGLATSLATGTTTITAAFSGVTSNSAILTVTAPVLVAITVTPSNPTIIIGMTEQFVATGILSDGTTQNLTSTVTWSSSNGSVAFISNAIGSQGLATSLGAGSTTITATSGSISGNTVLTVKFS